MKGRELVIVFLALCAVLGTACRREEIRTDAIHVPQLSGGQCAEVVTSALCGVDGVLRERVRVEGDRVWVSYDSMRVAMKNLEHAIAASGYDANDIPAYPKAPTAPPGARR